MFFKRRKVQEWEQQKKRSLENIERLHQLKKRLKTDVSHKELARLYFELRDGKWDETMFGNMADYWNLHDSDIPMDLCRFIKWHIGEKALVRYEYMDVLGHSEAEFEDHWQSLIVRCRIPI